jgi:hypothetical protein
MSNTSTKPVIFISYAHADEPEHPRDGEVQWLSFVQRFLQPAVKYGVFDLWVDRHMSGGAKWEQEIEEKLRACDIFILLVSASSMASNYVVDKEIAIVREREASREEVHFYPLLLRPTPKVALDKVRDFNLRPRDAKPFSAYSVNDREQHMAEAANEIAEIAERIVKQRNAAQQAVPQSSGQRSEPSGPLPFVHITRLPETAYERLVGRDAELKRLDEAWADRNTNILSLVAEGGAGKSALVNEWLKRLQAENYRGAEAVLGWSFYSQGSKERATSAEPFLNWALDKLGIKINTTSATAKGEAIAEALARRRVLLVLDGVEPLQHGLGTQQGELKDLGLRALLRRFAAMPPAEAHGLAVLTSRLAVKDIARWKDGAAPVLDVEKLSDEAGAKLLRDNGVWGTDTELRAASRAFGGHPLALGLLASFLKETQFGDVRRGDHIRELLADPENPRHDHAKRVMESYETEWLAGQPVPHAIMQMVGLFDRPASGDCLAALRRKPAIPGLTDAIVDLDDGGWRRAAPARRAATGARGPGDARCARRPSAGARVVRPAAGTHEPGGLARRPRPALRAPSRHHPGRRGADARRPRAALPSHPPRLPRWPLPGGAGRRLQKPHLPAASRRRDRILCKQKAGRYRQRPRRHLLVLREALRNTDRNSEGGGSSLGARRSCLLPECTRAARRGVTGAARRVADGKGDEGLAQCRDPRPQSAFSRIARRRGLRGRGNGGTIRRICGPKQL